MNKNEQIKNTLKQTKFKRKQQTIHVCEIKLCNNKLSTTKNKLNLLFLEAKRFYNHLLNQENIFNINTTLIKSVLVKNKEDGLEEKELTLLSSQMKQEIHKKICISIKSLSTKKKKGFKVGKLKYKSKVTAIQLKQFNVTYKFVNKNTIQVQNIGKIKVNGLHQLKDVIEFGNANLIKRNDNYYLKVTYFKDKIINTNTEEIGIDFGIKDSLTFSNGIKINTTVPLSKQVIKNHKRLSKKVKYSKNFFKQKLKLSKSYEKVTNKRKDIRNKVVGFLKNNYKKIYVQDENIKGWYTGLFGKQIQQSTIGGIMAGIKNIPHTSIVNRWYASTQECPYCLKKNKLSLNDREYKCSCGYVEDRDVHSARNILMEGSKIVPTERRNLIKSNTFNKKPLETETSIKMLLNFNKFLSMKKEAKGL